MAVHVEPGDWRAKVRTGRSASCVILVVDASGSMGSRGRMTASKGAILSLLLDAYVKRDRVCLIGFRRDRAEVLVPVTSSVEVAQRGLAELPVGGRTPLAAGLVTATSAWTANPTPAPPTRQSRWQPRSVPTDASAGSSSILRTPAASNCPGPTTSRRPWADPACASTTYVPTTS